MRFTPEELKKLALPVLAALAMLAAGFGLIWSADAALKGAERVAAAAQAEREAIGERLARIAEEEREVKEKISVYNRLEADAGLLLRKLRRTARSLIQNHRLPKREIPLSARFEFSVPAWSPRA